MRVNGVKRLIQQEHVDVNTKNRYNQTALYYACENGHTEVVQYLLENNASINVGAKPIAAVRHDHYDCVKLLLQHNADVHCTNKKLETPMSVAVQKHHYTIKLLLLQYGARPPVSLRDIAVQLPEHARVKQAKAMQELVDQKFINSMSENAFLAACSFAFKCGSVELAERVLSSNGDSELYFDAAYYSAKHNWPTILSKLCQKGVDVNILIEGQTPLYVACKEGYEAVAILLLNNGADPNVLNKRAARKALSPLQVAVRRGNAVIVDKLLEKGAKLDQPGEHLLHIALSGVAEWKTAGEAGETRSVEDRLSIMRMLLGQGVDVNALSDNGDTALYTACITQQLQVVQILLEAGADVNMTSQSRYPLIAACDSGNVELVNMLVRAGADVKCRKANDETCLHFVVNAYSSDKVSKFGTVNTIKSLSNVATEGNDACRSDETFVNIVHILLQNGAEANALNRRGETPLYAVQTNW